MFLKEMFLKPPKAPTGVRPLPGTPTKQLSPASLNFWADSYFAALAQVECVDFENIPARGPCILASNHINNLDVVYLGLYVPRHLHFMAKIELYRNPIFAWAIRLGGSFPVNRGENDTWALQQAGRVLTAGQMLCMFPEGTRSGAKAQMRRGKVGAVKLALEYQAPIIPMAIIGTQNFSLTQWRTNKIRIQAGQPLDMVGAGRFIDLSIRNPARADHYPYAANRGNATPGQSGYLRLRLWLIWR